MSGEKYTIGVDFGTLSGRALVVRVGDGHELASAEHAYEHGVITDSLPGARRPAARRSGRCRCPQDYVDVLRDAVPEAIARAGIDPADVIGIGTDFTACTMVPVRATARRCASSAEFARPAARLRQAVAAPFAATAGRPHQYRCRPTR